MVLENIIKTLENLGGKAHYSQIYKEYERVVGQPISKGQQAGIRACIESHSSDSERFSSDDIFYSVEGKGHGVWGLRSFNQ